MIDSAYSRYLVFESSHTVISLLPWWVRKSHPFEKLFPSDCTLHLLRIYFTILVGISKIHQASNLPWLLTKRGDSWTSIYACDGTMWLGKFPGVLLFFFEKSHVCYCLQPGRRLTWQWKITMLNRRYIFKWLGFRASHVSFRGGNSYGCYLQAGSVLLDWKGKSLMLRNPCDTKQTSRESIQNDSCVSVKLSWNFGLLFVWMTAFSSIRCGCGNTCLDPLLLFKISHTLPIQLQTSFNIAKKEWDAESIW